MFFTSEKNGGLQDILFNDLPFESYYLFDVLKSNQGYSDGQIHTQTHTHAWV